MCAERNSDMSIRTSAFSRREQPLGEGLDQLGLAHAGRAEEQERAERLVAVRQPDAGAPHGVGDELDGLLLPDHAGVQVGLEVLQALELARHQLAHGDPGAGGDDGGHVGLADDRRRPGPRPRPASRAPRRSVYVLISAASS